jgi:hypothetical protein
MMFQSVLFTFFLLFWWNLRSHLGIGSWISNIFNPGHQTKIRTNLRQSSIPPSLHTIKPKNKFCNINHSTSAHRSRLKVCNIMYNQSNAISLWTKVLCFVVMRSTKLGCFRLCSGCLWKALNEEGCIGLVHDVWTCRAKVLEYWMISSLKIKLIRSWKFQRNLNVSLVLLERSWWARFNGIYLVRFEFRMWEILISKWFLLLKIQINSKKNRFWKEKSVEGVVTLGPTAQTTLVTC